MTVIENLLSPIPLTYICSAFVLILTYVVLRLWMKLYNQRLELMDLRKELEVLLLCDRGMADRIKNQQQQMHGIVDRQDRLEINESPQVNYKQAIALMKRGATTDELVEACDISRGELELISHLHNSNSTIPSNVAR